MALLETINVMKVFGGLTAVNKVNFKLEPGRIVSIIGPNGAGKTTFFNTLTGIYSPDGGEINFNGRSLVGLRPDQIAARGISRTFQNIRLFGEMSVVENILVGMHVHLRQSPLATLLHLKGFRQEEAEAEDKAVNLMQYVGLRGVGNELAKNLPYGAQRRLEIARALAADPLLLLLDEPAAGMNPTETEELLEIINYIRNEFKVSVLLIEHDMSLVMKICERIQVLDFGTTIASGTPEQIANDPHVIEAYLGKDEPEEAANA